MKYLSLFSGIGGFELGIQRAFDNRPDIRNGLKGIPEDNTNTTQPQIWATCIGYSEIDKYAIKVYERHFNGTEVRSGDGDTSQRNGETETSQQGVESAQEGVRPVRNKPDNISTRDTRKVSHNGHTNYGDATTINAAELPDFDLLVGGFPCQAFSVAGKRAGFNDTRGTLFFDIARILKEKQPRHLVLENVKGLLSHDSGRTFTTIIGVLTDLGYLVEWQVLNSKDFGVPQNRERVYIVGHLGNECGRKVFPIIGNTGKNLKQLVGGSQGNRVYDTDGIASTIASQAGGLGAKTGLYAMRGRENGQQLEKSGDYTNTITSVTKDNLWIENARIRRLTPKECERLQGFPDNWTEYGIPTDGYEFPVLDPISDTQRYKMVGNAVTVNTVQAVMERLCL